MGGGGTRAGHALLRRASAHRTVLAVVFTTALLTITLATTVAVLHAVARDVAASTVLADATAAERVVQVEAQVDGDTDLDELDQGVRASLDEALGRSTAPRVSARLVSASYALPTPGSQQPDLTVFAAYDDLADSARVVAGRVPARRPAAGTSPVDVTLSQPAAEALGRDVGDRWTVRSRVSGAAVRVRLSGVFALRDAGAPARVGDRLLVSGVDAGSFTTYGPLVVSRAEFTERFRDGAAATWVADPDLPRLRADEVPRLRASLQRFADSAGADELIVESDLDDVLDRVRAPLTAVAAVVGLGSAPLIAIAALTLLTAGRLLGDRREGELRLLRARGASTAQLATAGLVEALAVTLPAVALAPWLAAALVALIGPAEGGATRPGLAGGTAWAAAAVAGLVVTVVLVAPLARRGDLRPSTGGGSRVVAAGRAGVDVLVVAAAAVAGWQLARYDGPLRPDASGRAQVDPLLVLVPTLLTLGASVLAMRLLPMVLAALDPLVRRSRGFTAALATWTVGRRLGRQSGPVLTALLAVAVATFSLTWLASWQQSARDQAAFVTGADVRVGDPAGSLTPADVSAVPGVTGLTPAVRLQDSFGDTPAQILALDAASAGDVVPLRADLATQPLSELVRELVGSRAGGLPVLPHEASALAVSAGAADARSGWQAVVQDDTGLLHALDLRAAEGTALWADLQGLTPPLAVIGLRVRDGDAAGLRRLVDGGGPALRVVEAAARPGRRLPLPAGVSWQVRRADDGTTVLSLESGDTGPLRALVTRGLADALGDQGLVADGNDLSLRLEVVGVVDGMPTVDPSRHEAVVVELAGFAREVFAQTGQVSTTGREWWLETGSDPAAVAAAVGTAAERSAVTVVDREAQQVDLLSGPTGSALVGVLAVTLLAAGLAWLSGYAAMGSALGRSRRAESAVLRALGADRRRVGRLLAASHAGVLVVAGTAGVAVGLGVAWWTLPKVTLTDAAAPPFPTLDVVVPWGVLAVAAGALLLLLAGLGRLGARATAAAPAGDERGSP